jgi:hypothetical protein
MQMVQPDISSRTEQRAKTPGQFQQQLEDRLHALKGEVSEQPFLCLAVAIGAAFVLNTFPARVLFLLAWKVISWLLGPAILLLGVFKLGDLFSGPKRTEPSVLLQTNQL